MDAVFRGNSLKAYPASTRVLDYEQHWNAHWQSSFASGYAGASTDASQPASTIRAAQDVHGNLIRSHNKIIDNGREMLYGRRQHRGGSKGDALRFQFSMIFNFN